MDCAEEDEINEFMVKYEIVLNQALHYIDHDDVEAKEGHVKTTYGTIASENLSLSSPAVRFNFIES